MFYSQQHTGRKLMWLYQHWKAELQTQYTNLKHILQVSTYQMSILFLFNQKTIWTVKQIQDQTQISKEIFLQVLDILLQAKLLICEEINGTDETGIQMNYKIKLADNFKR
jgi:cullin 1